MTREEVVQRAWRELEPHLREQGYELVEVEFGQEGHLWILRVYVDREGGVTLDHCAEVTHLLSPLLDTSDLVQGSYSLEVSSPGFNRPVRKLEDFKRFSGERIKIRTVLPVGGRKRFTGVLKGVSDDIVEVECDGTDFAISVGNIQRANLER